MYSMQLSDRGYIMVLQPMSLVDSSVRSFLYCMFLIVEYDNCIINIGIWK